MNEILGRKAIEIIKSQWGLPQRGFIAGGSIANIIWEIVSGNKAVVNDIDVFVFEKYIEKLDENKNENLFDYKDNDLEFYDGYAGVSFTTASKDFYTISTTEVNGIFNTVNYQSNTSDPSLVLKSFDINCTKVGYSIDEDKLYWTKEFEDFLKTGELKICNLLTPSHSAIRIVKKSKELNVKLDEFELKLIEYTLCRNYSDVLKTRFKERYVDMYETHKDILNKFFSLKRDLPIENYLKHRFQVETTLWTLESAHNVYNDSQFDSQFEVTGISRTLFFEDDNLNYIGRSKDFLFYMRNIFGNPELSVFWKDLCYLWLEEGYIDKEIDKEDINLLSRLSRYAPGSINNLRGMKLSEQVEFVKKIFDRFKDDPIIAISILEGIKVDKNIELDDQTVLLLELSVRKQIVNDTRGKVRNIMYPDASFDVSLDEFSF